MQVQSRLEKWNFRWVELSIKLFVLFDLASALLNKRIMNCWLVGKSLWLVEIIIKKNCNIPRRNKFLLGFGFGEMVIKRGYKFFVLKLCTTSCFFNKFWSLLYLKRTCISSFVFCFLASWCSNVSYLWLLWGTGRHGDRCT